MHLDIRHGHPTRPRSISRSVKIHINSRSSISVASQGTCAAGSDPAFLDSNPNRTKLAFQPQRRYYLEGRIIHKRKLSRKLFFLEVSLVRPKQPSVKEDEIQQVVSMQTPPSLDGHQLSAWEDLEPEREPIGDHTPESQQRGSHTHSNLHYRMEVTARFPVHSLKDLDDLWRKVQLGSVVKVYGDIEIPERNVEDEKDSSQKHRWSPLLHCLDFNVLELWQGKEGFESNPGSSEFKSQNTGSRMERRKRKSSGMNEGGVSQELGHAGKQQQNRGDESQPHCKFWLNSGKCNKEQCLFWHETDLLKLKVERRRWVEERIQAKRRISHHASDPHQNTTKNQHRERALYFTHWLIQTFTREFLNAGSGVLDIAGGRGDLSWELQTRQGIQATIVEPRPGKGIRKWQRKWLQKFKADSHTMSSGTGDTQMISPVKETDNNGVTEDADMRTSSGETPDDHEEQEPDEGKDLEGLKDFIPTTLTYPLQMTEPRRIQALLDDQFLTTHQDLINKASILVGLHPDQATEPLVKAAIKTGKPFAVIPCCVFGRDNPHRRLPKSSIQTNAKDEGTMVQCETITRDKEDEDDPLTRPVTSYEDFVTWLSTLHSDIETAWLNFEGMNRSQL
ncbi:hypothetical protein BGZ65_001675 [Modicella reniformis]|uniref:C3H1-type domain-containing protein n=1 Tax=Modicella reniformis TaxID=1440133 RepID=A0A9P6SQ86_9FUNG|nr:hypothetical protein BGZ65_001675 [Modicella reniformis]